MKHSLSSMIEKSFASEKMPSPQVDQLIFAYAKNHYQLMKQRKIKRMVVWLASSAIAASIFLVPMLNISLNTNRMIHADRRVDKVDPVVQLERLCDHAFLFSRALTIDRLEADVISVDSFFSD